MRDERFWAALDRLLAECPLRIDRPAGSRHPRYPDLIYPLDYGYLVGSTAADGSGIDVWRGSIPDERVTGALVTVDNYKRDAELKVLISCTPEEAQVIFDLHNQGTQAASLLLRE